jgi:hypothetical protein
MLNRWYRFSCRMGWHKASSTMQWIGHDNFLNGCVRCGVKLLWSSGGWFEACDQGGHYV